MKDKPNNKDLAYMGGNIDPAEQLLQVTEEMQSLVMCLRLIVERMDIEDNLHD